MFETGEYQLLDFGQGRRLERFASWLVDRPCPAAEKTSVGDPSLWRWPHARFIRSGNDRGRWEFPSSQGSADFMPPKRWAIVHQPFKLEIKLSPFGHVGVFAEQAENWDWIARRVKASTEPLRVLNLFAYTGGSTLSAAAAGAEVTHVDAARNTLGWARRNAELSELADKPIRWIADDAVKFVRRELRRGKAYDAVILDPPSYGHGRRGEVWRLSRHLSMLLAMCAELLQGRGAFMLLTCHTPGFDPGKLRAMMSEALRPCGDVGQLDAKTLSITAATGQRLPSGASARWQRER